MAELTIEQQLTNKSIAAGMAVAAVKLVASGNQAVERPKGSTELDAIIVVNSLVAASLDASEAGNAVVSGVLTALSTFVTEINRIEATTKV